MSRCKHLIAPLVLVGCVPSAHSLPSGSPAVVASPNSASRDASQAIRPAPSFRRHWPNQARAAVSLTYDDGMESHHQMAVPQLDAVGLRGTFFLNQVDDDSPWLKVRSSGHELAGHTSHHPCPRSFKVPGKPLEDLDLSMMAEELDGDLAQLARLGQSAPFTFAYPCGVTWVGNEQQSYVPQVRERYLAARSARPEPKGSSDLHLVPAQFGLETVDELLAAVNLAADQGGWLVLGFHGIGGGWLVTDAEVHQQFVRLLSRRSDIWIAPFGEVARHVQSPRSEPGGP